MTEIWKPIKNYESLYMVSNTGRILRLAKQTKVGLFGFRTDPEKILLPERSNIGYMKIKLSKNGIKTHINIHRLVAEAFIPNPKFLPCVNHIDGNKTNNNVNNLEWCSYSDNNLHAYRILKRKQGTEIKVKCIDTNETFDSISEAAKKYNISKTLISDTINKKRKIDSKGNYYTSKTAGGKRWVKI